MTGGAGHAAWPRRPGRRAFLRVLIPETGPVAERLRVREIDDEGRRLGADHPPGRRVRGDLAAGPDGAAIRPPHLTTANDTRVGAWAAANNAEIAHTPTNSSWLNRIEAQFTALRHFTLDGTGHASHKERGPA